MDLEEKIKQLKGPVFIFGASGFIGANLFQIIHHLRKDCYAITHNSDTDWRVRLLNFPSDNVLPCDITSASAVKNIFELYKPKTVFNLAAYGAYSKQSDIEQIYHTNFTGTLHLLENCKNISAFIHAGSSSEYGYNSTAPSETDELKPNSHYAISKVSASYLVQYYAKVKSVPAINLRLYSIYGDWEEPDRLIPRLIENARKGRLPPLVSPGTSRDFVYVTDAVEAFIDAALKMSPEIAGCSFNIASGQKTTLNDLGTLVSKEFKVNESPPWGSMAPKNWDVEDWHGNPVAASVKLNWKAKTSLADGLLRTFLWQESNNYEESILPMFQNPVKITKITVIVACYKDGQAIPILYERLLKTFNDMKVGYEIIFVNDCSPDNTEKVLEEICEKDAHVITIEHSRNFGSQSAFISGMEVSSGDAVVIMDGDLQDPPEVIPSFFEKWKQGYEVVYGRRVKRESSWLINVLYKAFYRIFHKVSEINIPVDAGDYSMIDRKVVNVLVSLPETEQFLRGLRAWVGFKQTGVDYFRPKRMFGVSTNSWLKNYWWARKAIFSFSFVPLQIIGYLGFLCTSIAFIAGIAQIIAKLFHPNIPHGITTIIVLILFLGGIQLLSVSFNGEYISKIFEETKKRPKYIRTVIRKGSRKYSTEDEMTTFISQQKKNG